MEMEIHIPGSLPGEDISARIDAVSTHRPVAWGTLEQIHVRSEARATPACPAHGRCGGCVLQHYEVAAQRNWKERRLECMLAAHASLAGASIAAMVPSPRSLGYRNNAKLVAAHQNEGAAPAGPAGPAGPGRLRRLVLGAYAPRAHQVVDLAGCAIVEPPLEAVATALRQVLQSHHVSTYDELRLTGELRYVVLRANGSGQVLATLVTSGDAFPAAARVAEALHAERPNVIGVVQNVNPSRGNAIFGARERTLWGQPTIEDRIGEVRLRISSRAFFQANRDVARAAYQHLVQRAAPRSTDRVVDAYTGVGGIALTLAPLCGTVVGIEENAGAVLDAEASAALNGITNARFVAGDVATRLAEIDLADLVVLNPPRKGCAPEVLQQVARLQPREIAYLSCAPETLLRDLDTLVGLGYRARELTPFDMLPHTTHLETLALLTR